MSAAIIEGHCLARLECDPDEAFEDRPKPRPWHIATADSFHGRTFCGKPCDFGWERRQDLHPEDSGSHGRDGECSVCFAAYQARRADVKVGQALAANPDALTIDPREVARFKARQSARKRPRKPATVTPIRAPEAPSVALDVFRMYRRELEALGTPEALAELQRRRDKRLAKRESRSAA